MTPSSTARRNIISNTRYRMGEGDGGLAVSPLHQQFRSINVRFPRAPPPRARDIYLGAGGAIYGWRAFFETWPSIFPFRARAYK